MKKRRPRKSHGRIKTEKEEKMLLQYIDENCNDDKTLSRYRVEGVLLYDFKLSYSKMYMVVMNLVEKGMINLINKSDGEYYQLEWGGLNDKDK